MGKITKQWLKCGSNHSFDLEICDIEIKRELGGDVLNFKGSPQYVNHEFVIKAIRSDGTYQLINLSTDEVNILYQLVDDARKEQEKFHEFIKFENNIEAD